MLVAEAADEEDCKDDAQREAGEKAGKDCWGGEMVALCVCCSGCCCLRGSGFAGGI